MAAAENPHPMAIPLPELALIFHQLPQPWHFQSCILHEAVCAAKLVNDAAEQRASGTC